MTNILEGKASGYVWGENGSSGKIPYMRGDVCSRKVSNKKANCIPIYSNAYIA